MKEHVQTLANIGCMSFGMIGSYCLIIVAVLHTIQEVDVDVVFDAVFLEEIVSLDDFIANYHKFTAIRNTLQLENVEVHEVQINNAVFD